MYRTIVILLAQLLVPIWCQLATPTKPNSIDGSAFDSLFSTSQSRRPIEVSIVPSKSNRMFLFLLNQTANGLEPVPINTFPSSPSAIQPPQSVVTLIQPFNTNSNSNLFTNPPQAQVDQLQDLQPLSAPIQTSKNNINLTKLLEDPFQSVPYRSSEETINSLIEGIFSDVSLQSLPPEEILFGKLPTGNITSVRNIFNDNNNTFETNSQLIPISIEELNEIRHKPIHVEGLSKPTQETSELTFPEPARETPRSKQDFRQLPQENARIQKKFRLPPQEDLRSRQEFRQPPQEDQDFLEEFPIPQPDDQGFGQKLSAVQKMRASMPELSESRQRSHVPNQQFPRPLQKQSLLSQEIFKSAVARPVDNSASQLPTQVQAQNISTDFPKIEEIQNVTIIPIPTAQSSNQTEQNQILFRLFQPFFNQSQTVPDFSSLTNFVTLQDYPPLTPNNNNNNNQVNYSLFQVIQEPASIHKPAPISVQTPTRLPAPIPISSTTPARTTNPVLSKIPTRRPLGRRRFSEINFTNKNRLAHNHKFSSYQTSSFARKGISNQEQPVNTSIMPEKPTVPEKVAEVVDSALPVSSYYYGSDYGNTNNHFKRYNNHNTKNLPTLYLAEKYERNAPMNRAAVSVQNNPEEEGELFEDGLKSFNYPKANRPRSLDLDRLVNIISLPNYKFFMGNKSGK